jgi:MFS family permease
MTQPTEPALADDDWPSPRVGWYAVGILFLAYTFSFADRYVMSLLIGPIKADLGLTDTQVSLLIGLAFAVFYTGMGIPLGRMVDRFSRRSIIAAGVALWSLMTAACGLARSFSTLFLARIGVGVGEAALSPAAYSMIADLFPPQRLGRALGVYSMGVYVGAGLAFIIGGTVIQAIADLPAFELPLVGTLKPWQLVFIVVGLPGLIVAALIYTVREPDRRHMFTDGGVEEHAIGDVFRFAGRHLRLYGTHFLGFAMLAVVFNAVVVWTPAHLERVHGMSPGVAGPILGLIIMIFGSAAIISGGWLADTLLQRGHKDAIIRVGIVAGLGAAPFALAPLASSPLVTLLLYCPLMFFAAFGYAAAAAGVQQVTPNRMRGVMSAMYLFVVNLAGIGLGPTLTAMATDYIFGNDADVGKSIALVACVSSIIAAMVLFVGLKPFRERAAALAENAQG